MERTEEKSYSIIVDKYNGCVIAADRYGKEIFRGIADHDDGIAIQNAIDYCFPGGAVRISAGKYNLDKSLIIDFPVMLEGDGRATEIVPPINDFAIKIMKTERSPLRTSYIYADQENARFFPDSEARLYGVGVNKLTVSGYQHGKGIYMKELVESWFKDLWIIGTHDGAAIHIDSTVMECEFHSIHCFSNGNASNNEASIIISSQKKGDANNNLHFHGVYVQNNNYIGMHIGDSTLACHPRLLYFHNCMFHSWLPPLPYDLVYIEKMDAKRGMIMTDSRLTASHNDNVYINLNSGSLHVANCIIGAAPTAFRALKGTCLSLRGNTIHNVKTLVRAYGANIIFSGNIIYDNCVIDADDETKVISSENIFNDQ